MEVDQFMCLNNNRVYDVYLASIINFKNSEYDQEYHNHNLQTNHGTARKSHTTITRHQEDTLSKATSSLPHQDDCKTRRDIK